MEEYVKQLVVNETTGEVSYELVTNLSDLLELEDEDMETEIEIKLAGATEEVRDQINFDNFKIGATFEGRRVMTRARGGYVIEDCPFTIR